MKKTLIILSLILMLVFICSCQNGDVPSGMKLASDTSKVQYSLYVPKSWVIDSMDTISSCHVSDSDRTGITVKKTSYKDENLWWNDYKTAISTTFDDFTLITENEDVVISKFNGKKFVFTCSFHGESFHKYEVIAIKNSDYVYEISIKYQGVTKNGVINYSDTNHADTMKKILDNFKFNDGLTEGGEVVFEAENTPESMKCASNIKIVDYFLFVPDSWTIEKTTGTVSSAYVSETDKTNVSVMQWNVNSYDYNAWWNEYKLQIYSAFDRNAIPSDDKGEVVTDENGKVNYLPSDIITITDEHLDFYKLGKEQYTAKQYNYSVKIDGNVYDFQIIATMHKASVY
ncbi:MAG: hypothetical protein IKA02_05190, partial [Clostridia bacterium]|nr:hypothetical protein [Clostridia bacterium]